jgi:cytochrome c
MDTLMKTRIVLSLAIAFAIVTMVALTVASCGKQPPSAATDTRDASATGVRYEGHVNAGGVAPPALPPPHRPADVAHDPKAGEGLFASMNCDGCHGGGATGWVAPSLVDGRWRYGGADEEIFQSIFYGRPKGMPAYGGVVGADGVWMIVSYLKSQPVPMVVPTTNYDDPAKPAEPTPPPTTSATPPASEPTDPRAKIAQYGCTACHAIDRKVIGPAFRDVAAKYHDQPDVQQRLETKVKSGGAGVWGDIPMPANVAVPDAEIHNIVEWILTSPDVRSTS